VENSLQITRDIPDAREVARMLIQHEQFREACNVLQNIGSDVEVLWMLGIALSGLDEHTCAIQVLSDVQNQLADKLKQARCGIDIATAYARTGDTPQALAICAECESIFKRVGSKTDLLRCEYVRAAVMLRQARHDDCFHACMSLAKLCWSEGLQAEWVMTLALAALAARSNGRYDIALQCAEQALPVAYELEMCFRIAVLEAQCAHAHFERGAPEQAMTCLARAQLFCIQSGTQLLWGDIKILTGNVLSAQGQFQKSVQTHAEAIHIYATAGYLEGVAIGNVCIGQSYLDVGSYAESLRHLHFAEKTAPQGGRAWSWALFVKGKLFRQLGMAHYAREALLSALTIFEASRQWTMVAQAAAKLISVALPADQIRILELAIQAAERAESSIYAATAKRTLGEALLARGEESLARRYLHESEHEFAAAGLVSDQAICHLLLLEHDIDAVCDVTPAMQEVADKLSQELSSLPEYAARVSLLRAQLAARRNPSDVPRLLRETLQAVRLIRASASDVVLSSHVSATLDRFYLQAQLLSHTSDDVHSTLQFAEERRAHWLRRILTMPVPLNTAPKPDAEAHTREAMLVQLTALRQAAKQAHTTTSVAASGQMTTLSAAALEAQRTYLAFDEQRMSQADAGHTRAQWALRSNADLIRDLTSKFGNQWTAVVIEPHAAGKGQWLRIILTPTELACMTLEASPAVAMCIQQLTHPDKGVRASAYGDSAAARTLRQEVAQFLDLERWMPAGKRDHVLILAPCEPFDRLAFPTLPLADSSLLIDRAVIRHVPALDLGLEVDARSALQDHKGQVLLIAPVDFGGAAVPLPYSQTEVDGIHALRPDAEVLMGAAASRDAVRARLNGARPGAFDLVHFATHAEFDPNRPRMSGIRLRDGLIALDEILQWRFEARMVVLSGCDGGRSLGVGGEERIGLETALIASGARSVLSSQWRTVDLANAQFMSDVLREWVSHRDGARALASVQRARSSHAPLGWASWRLTGLC